MRKLKQQLKKNTIFFFINFFKNGLLINVLRVSISKISSIILLFVSKFNWYGKKFPRKLSGVTLHPQNFCPEDFVGKVSHALWSLWSIYCAKIKALKILDRDSILLILPIDDGQKIALFLCSVVHITSNITYLLHTLYYGFQYFQISEFWS